MQDDANLTPIYHETLIHGVTIKGILSPPHKISYLNLTHKCAKGVWNVLLIRREPHMIVYTNQWVPSITAVST